MGHGKWFILSFAAFLLPLHARDVSAAPFIDVRAFLSIETAAPLPAGIKTSCDGSGCSGEVVVRHTFSQGMTETHADTVGIIFENTGSRQFSGEYPFFVDYGEFNAGGPWVGLGIDNGRQTASLKSRVSGPFVNAAFSCDLPQSNNASFGSLQCGVPNPDDNTVLELLENLAPGEKQSFDFTLSVSDSFSAIAEPPVLSALLPAIFGFGMLALRRRGRVLRTYPAPHISGARSRSFSSSTPKASSTSACAAAI